MTPNYKKPEYRVWAKIKQRCLNKNNPKYPRYGGRGITVCDKWLIFDGFFEDMGNRPNNKYSIERVDNDGNYCLDNCVWATRLQQQNNMSSNVLLEFQNKKQTIAQWSRDTGIKQNTIVYRLRRGWSVADALILNNRKGRKPPQVVW